MTNSSSANSDISTLSRDLADRAEVFCRHYFPNGRKQGNYWLLADTTGAVGQSLSVRLLDHGGKKAGNWTDYASGEFGDLIDLLHTNYGSTKFGETLKEARSFLRQSPSPAKIPNETSPAIQANERIAQARRLFQYGKPTYRTLASAYLLGRDIKRFGPALRYHPTVFVRIGEDERYELEKLPALLAKITNNDGHITGVARTFLDPQTKALADIEDPKRVLGKLHGNAIRFGTGALKEDLIVGEGLENILSVGTALPKSDIASCLTANHLGMFIPAKHIKRLWIARDNDKAGETAAQRLRDRLEPEGLWCGDLVPRLSDFNHDLLTHGVDALRDHLVLAMKEKEQG